MMQSQLLVLKPSILPIEECFGSFTVRRRRILHSISPLARSCSVKPNSSHRPGSHSHILNTTCHVLGMRLIHDLWSLLSRVYFRHALALHLLNWYFHLLLYVDKRREPMLQVVQALAPLFFIDQFLINKWLLRKTIYSYFTTDILCTCVKLSATILQKYIPEDKLSPLYSNS